MTLAVCEGERVLEGVSEGVRVSEGVCDGVGAWEGDWLGVPVLVMFVVIVCDGVRDWLPVADGV